MVDNAKFPVTEAQLVALFMQSVTYGIHVATFCICLLTLFQTSRANNRGFAWPWLVVAVVLFAIGTIDVIFNFYHNLIAFILYTGPGGPSVPFGDISNWLSVMRSMWFFLEGISADAVLMYRSWIIYGRKWPVVVPSMILWLAAISCAIVYTVYISTLDATTSIPDASKLKPWLSAYCTITLAVNLLSTALIVWRIGSISKRSSKFFSRNSRTPDGRLDLGNINRVIVESALLYTTSVAITLITELVGSNALYDVSDVSLELAGISFDLIIIRMGKELSEERTHSSACRTPITVHISRVTATDHRPDGLDAVELDVVPPESDKVDAFEC
ncbi:hypothetical protein WOLCODRAFT_141083 [Wolfiporia cocos MD-104 SS10]|uniref:Family A G protein-coupled receptor-like protein n=1 Tax=Wolfiporia cocos (strain MD-104) TaxID=742152 RepID=A0A2H3JMT4_WOLCO|nr:hypothetical protein WOLCODRAFT_141083 [Wolfiporia cocos MD-104 SS10]